MTLLAHTTPWLGLAAPETNSTGPGRPPRSPARTVTTKRAAAAAGGAASKQRGVCVCVLGGRERTTDGARVVCAGWWGGPPGKAGGGHRRLNRGKASHRSLSPSLLYCFSRSPPPAGSPLLRSDEGELLCAVSRGAGDDYCSQHHHGTTPGAATDVRRRHV